ncbi:cytochrome ubiquinol oxidase subunit I [Dictyobacter kobayashii]|uniref:Putative cytochrome bd menaquinol oxidase subunit I n=1 Tax=Dictyobacter kobayashii TaxID=2014872 RepID=A0A402AM55_9CHLR|nr:cytochrome ubiquinol oxidase subunit I [Dictyobacter kobayashii]GCE20251.1 putative cytochrome bd menaquinol oxidase subunit I [Dictyobacter kobayashii]
MMPDLLAARAQMGTSLAFHIIFSVLGVGVPLMLCISEGLALRTKNPVWMMLTRRWARAAAILFAIGAVSGTILSFELGLLWPTYTRFAGAVVGLPFLLEGFAFFTEAIFLGLYLYGWDRLSARAHWLCSFPIWISGMASAWFIVSANSWMNTPAGFVIKNGKVVDINPYQAIFNPSTPFETVHMILASYVATGFGMAAVYAFAYLRGKRDEYYRKGLMLAMILALVATPLQLISGDFNARFLYVYQPVKFAAMEGVFRTQSGAPISIGGLADPSTGQVKYALEIPDALSVLADYNPNTVVKGLDQFPREDWPNSTLVHTSFDGMVGSGMFALLVALVFWGLFLLKKRTLPSNRWLLWGVILAGPLSFLAVELGWMVTELGRQPWTIYGYLRTKDAVTTAPLLNVSFLVFSLIYVLLAVALIWLLLKVARRPLPQVTLSEEGYDVKEPEIEKVGV